MSTITPELLKATLAEHLKWWQGEGGKRANLRGADLSGANLRSADLRGAVGIRSYFEQVKADMFAVLATAPTEAPAVLAALEAGKVDGSTYDGECACLVGTMEHAAQNGSRFDVLAQIPRDASRPAEVFFQRIRPGDTPSNSPDAAIASVWVREFIAQQPVVTAP